MAQRRIAGQGVLTSFRAQKFRCLDRRQSQSTDSQTRCVTLFVSSMALGSRSSQYDVPLLKQLALDKMKSGLERCDIVEQLFSKFSSK